MFTCEGQGHPLETNRYGGEQMQSGKLEETGTLQSELDPLQTKGGSI